MVRPVVHGCRETPAPSSNSAAGDILYIAGHSHDKHVGLLSSPESRYVNVGSWCDEQACYATIDLDDDSGITPTHVHLATWGRDICEPARPAPQTRTSVTPKLAALPSTPH